MKIMVGYDQSNLGKEALKLAREWAKAFEASIEAVFVMTQSRKLKYPDIQKVEDKLKREVKNILTENNIPYEARLIIANLNPGEELVEFAKQNKINEIIIGVKRRSKVGKVFFGSTAQHVILNAPCPVVAIK
jgi:nucleotide-binding universal stress UspA family protein